MRACHGLTMLCLNINDICIIIVTLFRMSLFGVAHGCWRQKARPRSKFFHTYPTMMKLGTVIPYLKKIQEIYDSHDTPLKFCQHQHFFTGITKFCYIKKHRYKFHFHTQYLILLTFLFESLMNVLINMVANLMISAKMTTLGLHKIKIF